MPSRLSTWGNKHWLKFAGGKYPSVDSKCGVRQGCPISPLLFALVADILLRKLATHFPLAFTRAFADDTAMLTHNLLTTASPILSLFSEYGSISGLHLNLPKTVAIPLWLASLQEIKQQLTSIDRGWSPVGFAWTAKYLGLYVGLVPTTQAGKLP